MASMLSANASLKAPTIRPLYLILAFLASCVAGVWADGRQVLIGGDADRPPFSYLDERGAPKGFAVDLLGKAAELVGFSLEWRLEPESQAEADFDAGSLDALISEGLRWGREPNVDYTVPYIALSYGLFGAPGSDLRDQDELIGKMVAARRGDPGSVIIESGGKGLSLKTFDSLPAALKAVETGHADFAIAGYLEASLAIRDMRKGSIVPVGPAMYQIEHRVAAKRGSDIAARLDDGLTIAKATGAYEEIYRRWFGAIAAEPAGGALIGSLSAVTAASAAIAISCLVWALALRSRLAAKSSAFAAEAALRSESQTKLNELLAASEASKEEAKRSSGEESAFVAYINQELRTPLQGILGATELLEKTELDESQTRTLSMARSSAKRLSRILSDLLDAMGGEAGSLRMELSEFSYAEFASWIESSLRPYAEERGLTFRFASEGDERVIRTDRNRLAQVIVNLGSNAIKYTELGEVEIVLSLDDHALKASVNDTGPGIPDAAKASMFHPYRKGGQGGSSVSGSLGLGLSIVKSIVDAMGGTVSYQTQQGLGTRFSVTLPITSRLARKPSAGGAPTTERYPGPSRNVGAARESSKLAGAIKPGRAIIAEDEAINRIYLKRVLESAGWEVVQAVDGQAALEAAEEGPWDFVLMDVSMPRMDGLEATRRIRASESGKGSARVPIIALTAHAYAEDRLACADAGMDGFLSKPFTEAALWAEVRRAVVAVSSAGAIVSGDDS